MIKMFTMAINIAYAEQIIDKIVHFLWIKKV